MVLESPLGTVKKLVHFFKVYCWMYPRPRPNSAKHQSCRGDDIRVGVLVAEAIESLKGAIANVSFFVSNSDNHKCRFFCAFMRGGRELEQCSSRSVEMARFTLPTLKTRYR